MAKHTRYLTTIAATALLSAGLVGHAGAQTIKIGVNQPLTGAVRRVGQLTSPTAPRSPPTRSMPRAACSAEDRAHHRGQQVQPDRSRRRRREADRARQGAGDDGRLELDLHARRHAQARWNTRCRCWSRPRRPARSRPPAIRTSSASRRPRRWRPRPSRRWSPQLKIKKVDFLVVNNDWGRGAAEEFAQDAQGERRAGRRDRDDGPVGAGHDRAARPRSRRPTPTRCSSRPRSSSSRWC